MSEGRHPFQRRKNRRRPVRTPFQLALVGAIERFTGEGSERLSGRQLSQLLGKSANMASQLLNDGLVPSGKTVLEIAEVLEITGAEKDALLRAAIETKARQRGRDGFWLEESTRLLEAAEDEIRRLRSDALQSRIEAALRAQLRKRPRRGRRRKRRLP